MGFEKEVIGNAILYRADCMDVLPLLKKVCAVVTDPPYGIGEARKSNKSRSCIARAKDYGVDSWDDKPASKAAIDAMLEVSDNQVIFGGNYFALPPSKCWLVWDKVNGKNDFADCELAWTNLDKAVRRIQWQWHGMIRQGADTERFHPTQKPIEVMAWCIRHLPKDTETILDPFMGSGTTGVAAMMEGKKFIGVEYSRKYFAIAKRRIERAQQQGRLFA